MEGKKRKVVKGRKINKKGTERKKTEKYKNIDNERRRERKKKARINLLDNTKKNEKREEEGKNFGRNENKYNTFKSRITEEMKDE